MTFDFILFIMKKILITTLLIIGYLSATAQQFPWFEGFENPTFPPTGWSILDLEGDKTWERYTEYSTYIHSGIASAKHDWAVPLQKTALITPAIAIPGNGEAVLDFWSYIHMTGYQYCGVLVSTTVNNDINAFTEIKMLAGDELPPPYVWRHITVSLQNYAGQTIYIAFLYDNPNGPAWYIDDITITHQASYVDIQTVSLSPKSGDYAILHNNDPIKVRLRNNGGAPASGFNLQLLHNGTPLATETFSGSILSLEEAEYTFNATLNLSSTGQHTIQVIAQMPGDQAPENDAVSSLVTNLGCSAINTFPYFEGFENNGYNLPSCFTPDFDGIPLSSFQLVFDY